MKSGTNWLGGLLNTHHQISVVGEFHFQDVSEGLNKTLNTGSVFSDVSIGSKLSTDTRAGFEKLVKTTIRQAANSDALLLGDRTPHSIEPVTLSDAPHISIMRDGRDVLVSRAFHLYNNPSVHRLFRRIPPMAQTLKHFQADPWFFKKNPDQLLCHEVMVRESGIAWSKQVIADWTVNERYPDLPVSIVHYESLHADSAKERHRLFEFLEVDPEDCTPISGELSPGFETERPDEFYRKGAVGDWKTYFTDNTKRWYDEVAGEALQTLGYLE